jgi:hypothetical protein
MRSHDIMIEFLKTWGALIIAAIALAQPWILGLYRNVFRKGKVELHPTGHIEVGSSTWGYTVGLFGSIHALNRDVVVKDMWLKITRLKDKAQHILPWGVFRSPKLPLTANPDPTVQLCSSFVIPVNSPYHFNILFWDRGLQAETRPISSKLREAWTKYLSAKGETLPRENEGDINEFKAKQERVRITLYDDFSRTPDHVEAYGALQDLFYWNPGKYILELNISTARPDKSFKYTWMFDLSEQNSKDLRVNNISILQEICNVPAFQYNFAYLDYQEVISNE